MGFKYIVVESNLNFRYQEIRSEVRFSDERFFISLIIGLINKRSIYQLWLKLLETRFLIKTYQLHICITIVFFLSNTTVY